MQQDHDPAVDMAKEIQTLRRYMQDIKRRDAGVSELPVNLATTVAQLGSQVLYITHVMSQTVPPAPEIALAWMTSLQDAILLVNECKDVYEHDVWSHRWDATDATGDDSVKGDDTGENGGGTGQDNGAGSVADDATDIIDAVSGTALEPNRATESGRGKGTRGLESRAMRRVFDDDDDDDEGKKPNKKDTKKDNKDTKKKKSTSKKKHKANETAKETAKEQKQDTVPKYASAAEEKMSMWSRLIKSSVALGTVASFLTDQEKGRVMAASTDRKLKVQHDRRAFRLDHLWRSVLDNAVVHRPTHFEVKLDESGRVLPTNAITLGYDTDTYYPKGARRDRPACMVHEGIMEFRSTFEWDSRAEGDPVQVAARHDTIRVWDLFGQLCRLLCGGTSFSLKFDSGVKKSKSGGGSHPRGLMSMKGTGSWSTGWWPNGSSMVQHILRALVAHVNLDRWVGSRRVPAYLNPDLMSRLYDWGMERVRSLVDAHELTHLIERKVGLALYSLGFTDSLMDVYQTRPVQTFAMDTKVLATALRAVKLYSNPRTRRIVTSPAFRTQVAHDNPLWFATEDPAKVDEIVEGIGGAVRWYDRMCTKFCGFEQRFGLDSFFDEEVLLYLAQEGWNKANTHTMVVFSPSWKPMVQSVGMVHRLPKFVSYRLFFELNGFGLEMMAEMLAGDAVPYMAVNAVSVSVVVSAYGAWNWTHKNVREIMRALWINALSHLGCYPPGRAHPSRIRPGCNTHIVNTPGSAPTFQGLTVDSLMRAYRTTMAMDPMPRRFWSEDFYPDWVIKPWDWLDDRGAPVFRELDGKWLERSVQRFVDRGQADRWPLGRQHYEVLLLGLRQYRDRCDHSCASFNLAGSMVAEIVVLADSSRGDWRNWLWRHRFTPEVQMFYLPLWLARGYHRFFFPPLEQDPVARGGVLRSALSPFVAARSLTESTYMLLENDGFGEHINDYTMRPALVVAWLLEWQLRTREQDDQVSPDSWKYRKLPDVLPVALGFLRRVWRLLGFPMDTNPFVAMLGSNSGARTTSSSSSSMSTTGSSSSTSRQSSSHATLSLKRGPSTKPEPSTKHGASTKSGPSTKHGASTKHGSSSEHKAAATTTFGSPFVSSPNYLPPRGGRDLSTVDLDGEATGVQDTSILTKIARERENQKKNRKDPSSPCRSDVATETPLVEVHYDTDFITGEEREHIHVPSSVSRYALVPAWAALFDHVRHPVVGMLLRLFGPDTAVLAQIMINLCYFGTDPAQMDDQNSEWKSLVQLSLLPYEKPERGRERSYQYTADILRITTEVRRLRNGQYRLHDVKRCRHQFWRAISEGYQPTKKMRDDYYHRRFKPRGSDWFLLRMHTRREVNNSLPKMWTPGPVHTAEAFLEQKDFDSFPWLTPIADTPTDLTQPGGHAPFPADTVQLGFEYNRDPLNYTFHPGQCEYQRHVDGKGPTRFDPDDMDEEDDDYKRNDDPNPPPDLDGMDTTEDEDPDATGNNDEAKEEKEEKEGKSDNEEDTASGTHDGGSTVMSEEELVTAWENEQANNPVRRVVRPNRPYNRRGSRS